MIFEDQVNVHSHQCDLHWSSLQELRQQLFQLCPEMANKQIPRHRLIVSIIFVFSKDRMKFIQQGKSLKLIRREIFYFVSRFKCLPGSSQWIEEQSEHNVLQRTSIDHLS